MHHTDTDRALRQAATQQRQFYPGEDSRLGRGLEIALNEGVSLVVHLDGISQASVRSASDPEVIYTVEGTRCDCQDFPRAPGGRCKHRFAVALTRMAQASLCLQDHQEGT